MSFITVKHKDGRTADITAAEVAHYKSIGFKPVEGQVIEEAGGQEQAENATVHAPLSGTDQRLDLLLDEIRGLRGDIAAVYAPLDFGTIEAVNGESVELREPVKAGNDDAAKAATGDGDEVKKTYPEKPEPEKASTKASTAAKAKA